MQQHVDHELAPLASLSGSAAPSLRTLIAVLVVLVVGNELLYLLLKRGPVRVSLKSTSYLVTRKASCKPGVSPGSFTLC